MKKKNLLPLIPLAIISVPLAIAIGFLAVDLVTKTVQRFGVFNVIIAVVIAVVAGIVILKRAGNAQLFGLKAIGVGVYWDKHCTKKVNDVSWGSRRPGATKKRTIYIRNEGVTDSTLSLRTEKWSPRKASEHIFLTWDRERKTLRPNEVTRATLVLSISPRIREVTDFSFGIVIDSNALSGILV